MLSKRDRRILWKSFPLLRRMAMVAMGNLIFPWIICSQFLLKRSNLKSELVPVGLVSLLLRKLVTVAMVWITFIHWNKLLIMYLQHCFFTSLESTCCIISFGKILSQINAESTLAKIVAMVMVTRSQNWVIHRCICYFVLA